MEMTTEPKFRDCTRCRKQFPTAVFEGYKTCPTCRARGLATWQRHDAEKRKHGLSQRIDLNAETRTKLLDFFGHACAFCGGGDPEHLKISLLIHFREGGGDEYFNVVPNCTSCNTSRRGRNWYDWFRSRMDIFSKVRLEKLLKHHNA
jgi:hypothetical protein